MTCWTQLRHGKICLVHIVPLVRGNHRWVKIMPAWKPGGRERSISESHVILPFAWKILLIYSSFACHPSSKSNSMKNCVHEFIFGPKLFSNKTVTNCIRIAKPESCFSGKIEVQKSTHLYDQTIFLDDWWIHSGGLAPKGYDFCTRQKRNS